MRRELRILTCCNNNSNSSNNRLKFLKLFLKDKFSHNFPNSLCKISNKYKFHSNSKKHKKTN